MIAGLQEQIFDNNITSTKGNMSHHSHKDEIVDGYRVFKEFSYPTEGHLIGSTHAYILENGKLFHEVWSPRHVIAPELGGKLERRPLNEKEVEECLDYFRQKKERSVESHLQRMQELLKEIAYLEACIRGVEKTIGKRLSGLLR